MIHAGALTRCVSVIFSIRGRIDVLRQLYIPVLIRVTAPSTINHSQSQQHDLNLTTSTKLQQPYILLQIKHLQRRSRHFHSVPLPPRSQQCDRMGRIQWRSYREGLSHRHGSARWSAGCEVPAREHQQGVDDREVFDYSGTASRWQAETA